MAEPVKESWNQYWLGPMTMLGVQSYPPYAAYLTAERLRDQVHAAAATATNLTYSDKLKGFTLAPLSAYLPGVDMDLAYYTMYGPGSWLTCYPDDNTDLKRHLFQTSTLPDQTNTAIYKAALPANPSFMLSVWPSAPPTGQTNTVYYTLTFGQYFVLRWGMPTLEHMTRDAFPRLTYPTLVNGAQVLKTAIYPMTETDAEFFWPERNWLWDITAWGGDLYLTCAGLAQPWIIRNVGTVPSVQPSVAVTGGQMKFNLSHHRYALSGSLVTDWMHIGDANPLNDKNVAVYPPPSTYPAGCAIGIAAGVDVDRPPLVRLTYSFSAPPAYPGATFSWHTPVLMAGHLYVRPTHVTGVGDEDEVSGLVAEASESISDDFSQRTLSVTFDGVRFRSALASLPDYTRAGRCLLRYATGYKDPDDIIAQTPRGTLVLLDRLEDVPLDGDTYTVQARDLSYLLAETPWTGTAPCFVGWPAEEAIAYAAECGGIDPDNIILHPALSAYSQDNGAWWTRLTDPPLERYLLDPTTAYGYDDPPFLPAAGTTIWQFIQYVAETYQLRVEFREDNCLHVYDPRLLAYRAPVATYYTAVGATPLFSLRDLRATRATVGAVNGVHVEGLSLDKQPLHAWRWDPDAATAGQNGSLGHLVWKHVRDTNLCQQAMVDTVCAWEYLLRNRGQAALELTGNGALFLGLMPNDYLALVDTATSVGDTVYRITSINGLLASDLNEWSLTLEEDRLAP